MPMMSRPLPAALLCIAALLQGLSPVALSRDLYRYYDGEGKMVIDYRVPAEYAGAGYEVLNEDGVVIKVVPKELTEEEKQQRNALEIQQAAAEAERERLRKWDESLLLRYSTIADIEDMRERSLRDLRIRVSILKSNRRSLKQQVENYQSQAADLERSGREVDVDRLQVIEELQREISATDRAIAEREREIQEVSTGYQADIERFAQLLEVVELRRSMLAQDRE
jgi:hypothetical protein